MHQILMYFLPEVVPEACNPWFKSWNFEILNFEVTFESNAMIL